MSEEDEIESQSYKLILTSLCQHLRDIAEALNSIDQQLRDLSGTANRGKTSEFSFIRISDIGD